MQQMGDFISERKIAHYDLATFLGMLANLDDLKCEKIGTQGTLEQWSDKS